MILQKLTAERVHRNNWSFRGRCIEWQFSEEMIELLFLECLEIKMLLRYSFVITSSVFCFLFFFFLLQWESKIGVCILHGCALYTGKYGSWVSRISPFMWWSDRNNHLETKKCKGCLSCVPVVCSLQGLSLKWQRQSVWQRRLIWKPGLP